MQISKGPMSLSEEPGRFSGQFFSYGYTLCATTTFKSHGAPFTNMVKL